MTRGDANDRLRGCLFSDEIVSSVLGTRCVIDNHSRSGFLSAFIEEPDALLGNADAAQQHSTQGWERSLWLRMSGHHPANHHLVDGAHPGQRSDFRINGRYVAILKRLLQIKANHLDKAAVNLQPLLFECG